MAVCRPCMAMYHPAPRQISLNGMRPPSGDAERIDECSVIARERLISEGSSHVWFGARRTNQPQGWTTAKTSRRSDASSTHRLLVKNVSLSNQATCA